MRNTLQYIYSILVFTGALTTSYLMVAQNELRNQTRTAQVIQANGNYRRDAGLDNAVTKLFEMDNALSQVPSTDRLPARDRSEQKSTPLERKAGSTGERTVREASSLEFSFSR